MNKADYNAKFYEERSDSLKSAKYIVPYLLDIVNAQSVVDIGCGNGVFLSVFSKNGVRDYLGIDGEWVKKEFLKIPPENFVTKNFEQPFEIKEKFDLAISLEVAEHLSEERSKDFIRSITKLAPIVLFSAAIPLQGGTHHVNEQWPRYWADIFEKFDYVGIDCLRKKFWDNKDVSYWYSQNMILYVHKDILRSNKKLAKLYKESDKEILPLVHPVHYLGKAKVWSIVWNLIPGFLKTPIKKMFWRKQ